MTIDAARKLFMIYPYYDNPSMLAMQVENWNRFCGIWRTFAEVILVDDASPNHPAAPIMQGCTLPHRVYRVKKNIPWAQHHARNIGAHEAGIKDSWLFFSDMDIVFTPEAAATLFEKKLKTGHFHTFERHYAGIERAPKYHCNSFMVLHRHFWDINGYDADYCGTYGGDGPFLRQLRGRCRQEHHGIQDGHVPDRSIFSLPAVRLWGYEYAVEDANTKTLARDGAMKDKYVALRRQKKISGDERSKNPIRWDYERVL